MVTGYLLVKYSSNFQRNGFIIQMRFALLFYCTNIIIIIMVNVARGVQLSDSLLRFYQHFTNCVRIDKY